MTGANGLAWNEADQRLFYFGNVNSSLNFYVWDRTTGLQTQITGLVPSGPAASGSYYNNAFWFVRNNTDTLVRVGLDFTTPGAPKIGAVTSYTNFDGGGALTSFSFGDISIRASDGTLFGSSGQGFFRVNVAGATPSDFVRLSTSTTTYQIGFGQNGVLYGETAGNGNWFTMDTASGAASSLTYTSTNSSGAVIAFNDISEGSATGIAPQAAPEPSSLALVLPVLAAFGVVVRRRRK